MECVVSFISLSAKPAACHSPVHPGEVRPRLLITLSPDLHKRLLYTQICPHAFLAHLFRRTVALKFSHVHVLLGSSQTTRVTSQTIAS